MATRLLVVGGGKMGEALVEGLLSSGARQPEEVVVVEAAAMRRAELEGGLVVRYPGLTIGAEPSGDVRGAVIAVKPDDVAAVCAELGRLSVPRVLSIAAGVTLDQLEAWLEEGTAVVRAMPNTPALVGTGAAGMAGGRHASPEDLQWAERILAAVGTVVRLPEAALDAVTGLSGSGPAYVFLVAEALIDAGVLVGLPRAVARELTVQTILGSATLLSRTGDEPGALRAAVTSPGGTTAMGLRALETAGVRAAFIDAVLAATERSRQLGAR